MPENALSCIVCEKELKSAFVESENQPSEGVAFLTHGHYGSTVFDPMNGTYLEINICDECLTRAGHDRMVYFGRDKKPVLMPGPKSLYGMPTLVGWTPVQRRLTYWNPDTDENVTEDSFMVETYEEWEEYKDRIETQHSDEEIKEMFENV